MDRSYPHTCLWNNMSERELQQYDDCSIKELFKSLTPSYKQFIRKRSSVTIQEIELLRRQCVKGVSITDFYEKVASIKKHMSFSSRASTVETWSGFLEKCEKYNVSVHKALHYLEDNAYYCWNDMCKWYLMLIGKPKRNALLVKSMMTMHDNLYALIQEKRDKESRQKAAIINSLIGRICRFFTNQNLQHYALSDGLVAVIPQSKEDFIREGNDMHICVGGFDYSMRHAKKNSVIFFLRQSDAVDSSYCCCEARVSNGKIVLAQCRMEHNQQPENAVRKAAEDYCRVLNKTIQFKENALLLKAA